MKLTHRFTDNLLIVELCGKIDSSNSTEYEEAILEIKNSNKESTLVLDAEKLEYISSSGLRIILKLRKENPALSIINLSNEIYDIFDMTGFTDMMRVEKAFRKLSIDGCEFIGKGSNGSVYRYDDETIVKVYNEGYLLEDIRKEREIARKIFILGINSAIPYDIVRVGNCFGTVTELLDTTSLSRVIENGNNIDTAVKQSIELLKSIHSITTEDTSFPNMKERVLNWESLVSPHLPTEKSEKLFRMIGELPCCKTLIHGDFHTSNILIQKGELLLIDLETVCTGHPIFELGSMYNAYIGFSELDREEVKRFLGFDLHIAEKFWRQTLEEYLQTGNEDVIESVEKKARIIGYLRLLRRAVRRPGDAKSPGRKAHCIKMLSMLVDAVDSLDF